MEENLSVLARDLECAAPPQPLCEVWSGLTPGRQTVCEQKGQNGFLKVFSAGEGGSLLLGKNVDQFLEVNEINLF